MEVMLFPVDEEEVINKLYIACRTCYSAGEPQDMYYDELYTTEKHTKEQKLKLLNYVISSGHHSVLEHVQLTFTISGVSRSFSHQWVRHRLCSFSQQSQRYVEFKDGNFEFIAPTTIEKRKEVLFEFMKCMDYISRTYAKLTEMGIPAEDARAVLPNACCTNLTWSCNLRELMHICNERLCTCAQQEARNVAREVASKAVKALPFMKPYLVPKCEMLGYCNEPRRSCGRKKLKEEVLNDKNN